MRKVYGPEHPDVVWATAALGRNQFRLGRVADGERNMRWALDVKDPNGKLSPRDITMIGPAMTSLLMQQRRWADAEPLALQVLHFRDSLGDTLASAAAAQLDTLYTGWGKPGRAAEYRRSAR